MRLTSESGPTWRRKRKTPGLKSTSVISLAYVTKRTPSSRWHTLNMSLQEGWPSKETGFLTRAPELGSCYIPRSGILSCCHGGPQSCCFLRPSPRSRSGHSWCRAGVYPGFCGWNPMLDLFPSGGTSPILGALSASCGEATSGPLWTS